VIERVRGLGFADALAAAGAALVAAGLVVTGDGLVAAAQHTPGSSAMNWQDRLLLGLWNFRLEHALWFTIGLLTLWFALATGAELLGRREQAARLVGGVAVGFVLLAAAVAIGSTIVAVSGSVGSGALGVTFTRNERIFTWLLQVATAASLSAAWLLAGSRLGEVAPVATAAAAPEPDDALQDEQEQVQDAGDELEELTEEPPPPPPPVPLREHAVAPPAPAPAAASEEPATPGAAARRTFRERLAFSPHKEDAQRLLDELATAEREGRVDDVTRLAQQIDAL
jgi:hypothetical protein